MTTPQEMKDRYTGLYDYMAQSRDTKNLKDKDDVYNIRKYFLW